jgi:enhancing lycopene biosynthesis protein 2
MVKNLPTVERSTKIRFGKNVPDSDVQAENTIIINASNTLVTTPNSGSIYMAPVRFRDDFTDTNIVLMMYNRQTGELSESGESASNLVGGQTLQATTERGNATTGTVQFTSVSTSLVTGGKVGVSNLLPGHTLSVGSNVYIDDTGSNVLVISGGALLSGNLTVQGGVTSITTENLKIKDAIIELGQNNTSEDRTLDLGLIMTRPQSNVTIGFLETSKEIVMGFTESSADSNVITPLTSEDINVHVYGRLYTEANVGILNTDPMHSLDVGSNLYVDEFGSNILVVTGNTSVSGDLTVDNGTMYVDVGNKSIGLGTVTPSANLHVVGNAYISSTTNSTTTTTGALIVAGGIGIGGNVTSSNISAAFDQDLTSYMGRAAIGFSGESNHASLAHIDNNTTGSYAIKQTEGGTTHVNAKTGQHIRLNINNNEKARLTNSGDFYVDTDTLYVDAVNDRVGINTATPNANLHVNGNTYVSSTTDATTTVTGALIVAGGMGIAKKIVGQHANFEDVEADSVTITDSTTSTSVTTGALKVVGGISTQENLNVEGGIISGGRIGILSGTDASSKTTGALIVTGGVGIAKNIHALNANFENVEADSVTITDNTTSSSATTGALKVAGGISTQENLNVGAVAKVISGTDASSKTTGALIVTGGVGISKNIHALNANFEDVEADSITVTDTTTSTSATTGALKVAGGISTQENLNVGAVTKVLSATDASSKTTGALIVTGGVGISKNIHALNANFEDVEADSITITDTTSSINQTSGALKIAGGLGVSGNVHCGNLRVTGNVTVTGNTLVIDANTLRVKDPLIELGKDNNDGTDLGLIMHNPLINKGNVAMIYDFSESIFEIGHTLQSAQDTAISMNTSNTLDCRINGFLDVTGVTDASSNTTGGLTLSGGLGVAKGIFGASATITDTTTSTSATTGALKVAGGISTQENLNVGAVTKVLSDTDASSKTTGALIVTGGVGISKNIHALHANFEDVEADSVTVTDATEATSSTTGALKSAGGVGIAKDVYVGERAYVTGGLITNTGQVSRKTYSYSGNLATNVTAANGKITLTFTNHTFYAKIIAQLIESDAEVSTLILECAGGNWSGGTPLTIAKGTHNMFGDTNNTNPWSATINFTANTVDFQPNTTMADNGHYNIFVEYTSQHADGKLSTLTEGTTERINWGY